MPRGVDDVDAMRLILLAIPDQNAVVAAEVMVIPRSAPAPSSPWLQRRHELHRFYVYTGVEQNTFGSSGFTGVDVALIPMLR